MRNECCFHCGLPVASTRPPTLVVDETLQAFCCHGCKAVTDFIIKSGNVEYYQHREEHARTFNQAELPKLLDKLKLYDNDEIQREIVSNGKDDNLKEAWLVLDENRCTVCIWLNLNKSVKREYKAITT